MSSIDFGFLLFYIGTGVACILVLIGMEADRIIKAIKESKP